MVGKERALEIMESVLDRSPGDQTQAVFMGQKSHLTRFSSNYIHQNVGESDGKLLVKVVRGKSIGEASTNLLDEEGISRTVERAAEIASVQRENPHFRSLPPGGPITSAVGFASETAEASPEDRAEGVRRLVGVTRDQGAEAYGSYESGVMELAVCNSLGARAYQLFTQASLRAVVMAGRGTGFAEAASSRISDIDPVELGRVATEKCSRSREAEAIEPGEYTVILEPQASAELVNYLVRLGFSARAVQEGRSFLTGETGQRIVSEKVNIWDDGTDPGGLPLAFDFEGVPKRKLPLVEAGKAVNVVHDSQTAAREGGESTGHAIPYAAFSPMALNLFMGTGDASMEDMIASTRRGLLVTRFHYTNPIHPVKAMFTGMTRDGTFMVENGRITRAVKNLRFTESILKALSEVEMIGSESVLVKWYFGGTRVPPLKIRSFNFTGVTEH